MGSRVLFLATLVTMGMTGCAARAPIVAGPRLTEPRAIEMALRRAQTAYILGDFDQSVDETTPVLEGAADKVQHYRALRLRALARCRADDAPPSGLLARQLTPTDRWNVMAMCAAAGPAM